MDSNQKWEYFRMLVELVSQTDTSISFAGNLLDRLLTIPYQGYKEIEVSFPSASDTDYNFVRRLVETPGAVPDDVWVQVLTPCRPELIRRTVDSLRGSKKAILHLYIATSPCFQEIVFGMTNDQTKALAVECTKLVRSLTKDDASFAQTEWAFEFSPETFSESSA